jgi:eukaryotic-like serine/threonine-protein kinase
MTGKSARPTMSFEIGDIVGTYRILQRLGSGAVGAVYKVEHIITKRVEAMKVVAPDASSTPEQDQRFLREIRLQAGLSHPNIAAVHNAFRENGHLVMIMELIQGKSLKTLMEAGELTFALSIHYACQALAALENAHAHGVVHRDISPANMIVTQDGTLKLTDFGLAKSPADVRLTERGVMVGSLYYTSPEQVRGCETVDRRSDIYSMGAVLYELATGKKMFFSDNAFTLMMCHVGEPPVPPSNVNPDLPPALDEMLLKALDKDPANRFQSAEAFRYALEGLDGGQGAVIRAAAVSGRYWGSWRQLAAGALPVTGALLFSALLALVWRSGALPITHRLAPVAHKPAVAVHKASAPPPTAPPPAPKAEPAVEPKPEPAAAALTAPTPQPPELTSASRPKTRGHVRQAIVPASLPKRDAGRPVQEMEPAEPPPVPKPDAGTLLPAAQPSETVIPSTAANTPGEPRVSPPENRPATAVSQNQAKAEVQPLKKGHNPFRRALTWAAHPFHKTGDADHPATTENSKEQPSVK